MIWPRSWCALRTPFPPLPNTIPKLTRTSSMASVPFTTLCFSHKPTALTFGFGFLASDRFRFGGGSAIRFERVQKNRRLGIPVCRAGSAVVAFRDLDADDFRHPLDQQVCLSPIQSDVVLNTRVEFLVIVFLVSVLFFGGSTNALWFGFHFVILQNTLILRAIPGLNELGKALLGIKQLWFAV